MDTRTGQIADMDYFKEKVASGQMSNAEMDRYIKPIEIKHLTEKAQHLLNSTGRVTITRNSRCPCGSGKRFKRCCMTGELK